MNIHKLETHQHEIPYFMLPRETVNLITNPDSLAIWSYLQSKPKDWKLIETQLRERFGLGRKRYLDAMRHLRDLGLYEVKRYKDDDNRFTGSRFHIYHLPQVRHSTLVENDTCIKEKESLKEKESFNLEQDTPLPPKGEPSPDDEKPKTSKAGAERVMGLYNILADGVLSKAMSLTPKRQRQIDQVCRLTMASGKQPFADYNEQAWGSYFQLLLANPWNRGENQRGWKADFDYAIRTDVVLKTLEREYA